MLVHFKAYCYFIEISFHCNFFSLKLKSHAKPLFITDCIHVIFHVYCRCLNQCTYCKTKHARGELGSYPPEEIVERARQSFQGVYRDRIINWLDMHFINVYFQIKTLLAILVGKMVCSKMSALPLAECIHWPYTIFTTRITNLSSALWRKLTWNWIV